MTSVKTEINGLILMRLIKVAFLLLPVRGCSCHAGHYHVDNFLRHESEQRSHPSPLPVLFHFNLLNGEGTLTSFAGIIFSCT